MNITFREYHNSDRKGLVHCTGLLQDYIAGLDPLHRIRVLKDFDGETYVDRALDQVEKNEGAIFIAEGDGHMIGYVMGIIDCNDHIEGYPSVDGSVLDLIVLPEYRGQRVGNELMQRMEQYFASKNCNVIKVDCFGPNKEAYKFYEKLGYTDRLYTLIRPIKKH